MTVVVAVMAVVLGAVLALRQMPRDIFPTLGIPTIYVAQPYGGMDPAQMEGYLTYYYEYHFLYITGIEHVESQVHPGGGAAQAAVSSRHRHVPGDVRDGGLRQPRAGVHAARDGAAVRHAVRRRQRAGGRPGVFERRRARWARCRTWRSNRVRPLFATLPGVSAPPPFGGSARSIVINVKPERLRAYNMSPDEDRVGHDGGQPHQPVRATCPSAASIPMVPLNSVVKNIKDLESVPIRTGVYPTVFVRDVGTVVDGSDIVTSYALVNGRRTVYIPVTKRADASTLSVVNLVKQNLAEVPKRAAAGREGELRVRPVALRDARDRRPDAGGRAGRAADGLDDSAVPAGLAQRVDRGDQHSALA